MQPPLNPIFSQIKFQVESIKELMHCVSFFSMEQEIYPGGRTCLELLRHIVLLPEADYRLSQGAAEEEIRQFYFYWEKELTTIEMLEARLDLSFIMLEDAYKELEQEDLVRRSRSYWGTAYSQTEWLLTILTHLSHHRSQLFSFLKVEGEDLRTIQLFE
ncbi:DinB family protein [Macrococcus equipercicus]|uniref:DinB family protein n=1 Tax=Macrococcus equipercicus TaxID=69967 RepID=A0A9Q9BLQ2_9STAP|nr:DinB family protein [Macrococcus equipercicus]UTH13475.1 DinB family protein [Macrococcus equipercicus]